jgi:hypothetical protein
MELFFEQKPGPRLSALLEAQKPIAALYEPWLQGEQIDRDRLRRLHEKTTVAAHRYYVESIPIYRKLAEDMGLVECSDPDMIRTELASSDHLFKSYPQEWIDARDFKSMTEWAGQVTSGRPRPNLDGIKTIDQWLGAMHQAGWILRFGTFVIRAARGADRPLIDAFHHPPVDTYEWPQTAPVRPIRRLFHGLRRWLSDDLGAR